MKQNSSRITEIDFLRGVAIILMTFFHIAYDLNEFYNYDINYESGIVDIIGFTSAIMFMILTGISCSLSRNNFKRGIKVLGFAFLITLATYFYDPSTLIGFGILHLLGFSILMYPLFKKLNEFILTGLGILIIIIGKVFAEITLQHNYLFPLGLTSSTYASLDYYPMFPYFGVFLIGMALKKIFYPQKRSLLSFSLKPNIIHVIGQRSLSIYLLHQPIILLILAALAKGGLIHN